MNKNKTKESYMTKAQLIQVSKIVGDRLSKQICIYGDIELAISKLKNRNTRDEILLVRKFLFEVGPGHQEEQDVFFKILKRLMKWFKGNDFIPICPLSSRLFLERK